MIPDLTKTLLLAFSRTLFQARVFKLCIIITLLWVYEFIPGLMTLTLFHGHRRVRIINCNFSYFLSFLKKKSCSPYFKRSMVLVYIQKIRHCMLCVTGMFFEET